MWLLGKIENHTARPLSQSEIQAVITREEALRTEVAELSKDKVRLDWLETHPLKTEIKGGSEDGHTGTFWGCGAHSGTLRETIDVMMTQPPILKCVAEAETLDQRARREAREKQYDTTDPTDPNLGHGVDEKPVPQHKAYLVLSEQERAKGFVRPVRRKYQHMRGAKACRTVTTMGLALCETYARDPKFYGSTYCCACSMHLPVEDFDWIEADGSTGPSVGT